IHLGRQNEMCSPFPRECATIKAFLSVGRERLSNAMKPSGPQRAARWLGVSVVLAVCLIAFPALAQSLTNLGITPLPELAYVAYKVSPGGLYPNYANNRPPAHFAAGMMIATNQIQPLDATGNTNASSGKIVLLSIGMSNTTDEFASLGNSPFKTLA